MKKLFGFIHEKMVIIQSNNFFYMAGEWVAEKGREYLDEVFGSGWNELKDGIFQGRCPGEEHHSKSKGAGDCRVHVGYGPKGEKPGAYCFHHSCKPVLDTLNQKFRELIFAKKNEENGKPVKNAGVAREPHSKAAWIPDYSEASLRSFVAGCANVNEQWFMERSPVDPRGVLPGEFLEHCFDEGERVLVFSSFWSQGDFGWLVGQGGVRLASERGVKPVRSELPTDGGKDGVWYLCQPVDGNWHPNPRSTPPGKFSRRSEESVTRWRHYVLESDEAPAELWFKFLAMLDVPIKAVYSSAGKSWHALVEVPEREWTKADMDVLLRDKGKRVLPIFGADPGALTPVRLTRLPGCTRNGCLQKLIYLNPNPKVKSRIVDMVSCRSL